MMQKVQSLGGVQRVVTCLFNRIVEKEDFDVTIIAPMKSGDPDLYYVNSKIKQIPDDFFGRKPSLIRRMVKKANSLTGFFDRNILVKIVQWAYFPGQRVRKLKNFLIQEDFDIVIGASPHYSILAALALRGTRVKCIAWMHSTYGSYFRRSSACFGLECLFKKVSAEFDRVLVLTRADKYEFEKNIGRETDVFYNPVTIEAKKRSILQANSLLFVGRINFHHKGVDLLVEVMRKVCDVVPQASLEIVGDGEPSYLEAVYSLIKKNHLENNITLCGMSNDVGNYYERASLLLVTSKFEGFGLVITEALTHGVPVISFEASGPNEILENGSCGYLIPTFDTDEYAARVIELLKDEGKLRQFSSAALARAKAFSVDDIVGRLITILEQLVLG